LRFRFWDTGIELGEEIRFFHLTKLFSTKRAIFQTNFYPLCTKGTPLQSGHPYGLLNISAAESAEDCFFADILAAVRAFTRHE
jgi:hypothetical protein